MAEKAIRQDGTLWAYEPDLEELRLLVGNYYAYLEEDRVGIRIGELVALYPDEGVARMTYDDFEDTEIEGRDFVGPARPISSRRELRR